MLIQPGTRTLLSVKLVPSSRSTVQKKYKLGIHRLIMVNTRIESALQGIHEDTLEQLAVDLLKREEFDVETTSTSGADNKRDALIHKNGEQGIVHCSINEDLERKIKEDSEKAAKRPEIFDFFYFFTNQDRATILRDRLEEEITEQYGYRTRIYDFEYLRNSLMGDKGNHDLARQHLSVDPSEQFSDINKSIVVSDELIYSQNQPRLSINEWGITGYDELLPLTLPDRISTTQSLLYLKLDNIGNRKVYNINICLSIYFIQNLSNIDFGEITKQLETEKATSEVRRKDRRLGDSPQNFLDSSESTVFITDTFVQYNEDLVPFSMVATNPVSGDPEGLAVGVKLLYEGELEETYEQMVFAAFGEILNRPSKGTYEHLLGKFYRDIIGYINNPRWNIIFPSNPDMTVQYSI